LPYTTGQRHKGPYYQTGSPERTSLIEEGVVDESITLTGHVFDKDCNPVAGAWLDFWQADGNVPYDNAGYRLRGHQFTDNQGKYILKTVVPGGYPGRTNHIHGKVSKNERDATITSQLFSPGRRLNNTDRIYHESLLVAMGKDNNGQKVGFFNFRLNHE
jgi:protocatechuate 3,4-dioxygenase beta subunit